MLRKSIHYISGLGLLLAFAGCGKYLEKEPDNRTKLNTPEKISQLLAIAYPQANFAAFTEISSDNAGDIGFGDAGSEELTTANADAFFFRDTRSVNEDSPEFYWFASYKAIAAANQALAAIETLDSSSQYNGQRGEALVARAYAHFMLVNLFSKFYNPATASTDMGIPYVTEPETVFIKQYERKSVQYVYDMIEKDLLAGIPLINDQSYKIPKYHFTKVAAAAFAARFYLYKKDYNKVLEYAVQAVPGNNFVPGLKPWNTVYGNIGLNAIALRYAKSTENSNLLLVETRSYWARVYAFARYGLTTGLVQQILRREPVTGGDWAFAVGYFSNDHDVVPKIDEYFVTVSVNAEIGDGYVMVPLFTVEEVLFNVAEALTYNGRTDEAIALLNQYLSTRISGYNPSNNLLTTDKLTSHYQTNIKDALIQAILDYKRPEFVHEGMRWFDILRYHLPVVHTAATGQSQTLAADDLRKVFQIPATAKQSGIQQNPR